MRNKSLMIIFLVVFVDLLGFGIIIPILPYYAKSLGASGVQLGWLMACYSGMQFLFSPFWGRISDRWGRRPVIILCLLGMAIAMRSLGNAHSLMGLFVARLVAGFFGANISTASAYIADVTPPEKRAQGMGIIGASFGLGFLFGPAMGGILSQWSYSAAAYAAAGLSLFNFILAALLLKEPSLPEETRKQHRNVFGASQIFETLVHPKTGLFIFLFFLITTGFSQLETVFALFLLARFKLGAHHAGYLLALMALVMVIVQGGVIGRLVRNFGESKLIFMGTGIMALALFAVSVSPTLLLFTFFLLIHVFGYSISNPSLSSLVSKNALPGAQGATLGLYQSAGSLGRILGPLSAGFLFDHLGIQVPFWVACMLFGVACMLIGMGSYCIKPSTIMAPNRSKR